MQTVQLEVEFTFKVLTTVFNKPFNFDSLCLGLAIIGASMANKGRFKGIQVVIVLTFLL